MALPEERVGWLLDEVSAEFSQRHQQIRDRFLQRFEQVGESLWRRLKACPNKDDS